MSQEAHDAHHSSSTTRTSTKKVFLLTRFLKVSGLWQKLVYVLSGQGQRPNNSNGAKKITGNQYKMFQYLNVDVKKDLALCLELIILEGRISVV